VKLAAVRRKLERVDHAVEKAIADGETPGAVVMARMGELSYERAFGAATTSPQPCEARLDTVYDLASLTKVLATTAACMRLVAQGKLDADRPVADWIPAFSERGKGEVRVRHLLTHSSGLRPWRAYYDDLREREIRRGEKLVATPAGRESILSRIVRSAPLHAPGEAAVYGDLGFIVLGEVVAAAAGEGLGAYCAREIWEPLGMRDTCFHPVPWEGARARIAATELCPWRDRVVWGEVHDGNAFAMGGEAGHAGLFAPAPDVLRFGLEMLSADRGESALFPREVAAEFFRRQDLPPGSDWALGWDTPTPGRSTSGSLFSRRSIGHTGFTGTSLWIDLDAGCVIVLLANRVHLVARRSQFKLRPHVHDLIREAFSAA
jgi:CubicO group peptidase (beta-lactamase class C family)